MVAIASRYIIHVKKALSFVRPKNVQILTIDDEDFMEHHEQCPADALKYHVLMPFIHGSFTSNDRYLLLLRQIQAHCATIGIRLDIAFGSYFYNIPNEAETDHILEEILTTTKNKGVQYDAKVLAGHSIGALLASEKAMPSTYDALIQIGCSLSWGIKTERSLASYPKVSSLQFVKTLMNMWIPKLRFSIK